MPLNDTVLQWKAQAKAARDAHFDAARHSERMHLCLGAGAALLSALVGCGILVTLNLSPSYPMKILAVIISLLAAVLSSMNTLSNSSKRIAKHASAGCKFENLYKECQFLIDSNAINQSSVESLRKGFNEAHEHAALLPAKLSARVIATEGT